MNCFILVIFIVFSGVNVAHIMYASEQEKTKVNVTIESGDRSSDKEPENSELDTPYNAQSKKHDSIELPHTGELYFYRYCIVGIFLIIMVIIWETIWRKKKKT